MRVASSFGFSSGGSCRILTCSGGSEIQVSVLLESSYNIN